MTETKSGKANVITLSKAGAAATGGGAEGGAGECERLDVTCHSESFIHPAATGRAGTLTLTLTWSVGLN